MIKDPLTSLLHFFEPEKVHDFVIQSMNLMGDKFFYFKPIKFPPVFVNDTPWANPFGLAAGFDKNAQAYPFLANLGFGSLELGTITLHPQEGNPKPRIFRYSKDLSLRNSMGFPNHGFIQIAQRLPHKDFKIPWGMNIGPNKNLSPQQAMSDLLSLAKQSQDFSPSWITLNISSPNTVGLRNLDEVWLKELFQELKNILNLKKIFLKISPDINQEQTLLYHQLASHFKLGALIATNTTIMPSLGSGGVSGKWLKPISQSIWKNLLNLEPTYEVIAVGGFSHFNDWLELWARGGKTAQFYTSFIYSGLPLMKHLSYSYGKFLLFINEDINVFFSRPLSERKIIINDFLNYFKNY
jgi:dihydroorotate dehydrogenase